MVADLIESACTEFRFRDRWRDASRPTPAVADREGIELTDADLKEIPTGARGNLHWAINRLRDRSA